MKILRVQFCVKHVLAEKLVDAAELCSYLVLPSCCANPVVL